MTEKSPQSEEASRGEVLLITSLVGLAGCVIKAGFDYYIGTKIGLPADAFSALPRFFIEFGPVYVGSCIAAINSFNGGERSVGVGIAGGMIFGSIIGDVMQLVPAAQSLELPIRAGLPTLGGILGWADTLTTSHRRH